MLGVLMDRAAALAVAHAVAEGKGQVRARADQLLREAQVAPLSDAEFKAQVHFLATAGVVVREQGLLRLSVPGREALGAIVGHARFCLSMKRPQAKQG